MPPTLVWYGLQITWCDVELRYLCKMVKIAIEGGKFCEVSFEKRFAI